MSAPWYWHGSTSIILLHIRKLCQMNALMTTSRQSKPRLNRQFGEAAIARINVLGGGNIITLQLFIFKSYLFLKEACLKFWSEKKLLLSLHSILKSKKFSFQNFPHKICCFCDYLYYRCTNILICVTD